MWLLSRRSTDGFGNQVPGKHQGGRHRFHRGRGPQRSRRHIYKSVDLFWLNVPFIRLHVETATRIFSSHGQAAAPTPPMTLGNMRGVPHMIRFKGCLPRPLGVPSQRYNLWPDILNHDVDRRGRRITRRVPGDRVKQVWSVGHSGAVPRNENAIAPLMGCMVLGREFDRRLRVHRSPAQLTCLRDFGPLIT